MAPNPYEPAPTDQDKPAQAGRSMIALSVGIMTALVAVPVIGSGLVALAMEFGSRGQPGTRYATYDRELFVLGVPTTPLTTYLVAFIVGPVLIGFSIYCRRVYLRGFWRVR